VHAQVQFQINILRGPKRVSAHMADLPIAFYSFPCWSTHWTLVSNCIIWIYRALNRLSWLNITWHLRHPDTVSQLACWFYHCILATLTSPSPPIISSSTTASFQSTLGSSLRTRTTSHTLISWLLFPDFWYCSLKEVRYSCFHCEVKWSSNKDCIFAALLSLVISL